MTGQRKVFPSKLWRSQQGFSMIEVMVSFGLLAIAGLAAMQMSSMVMGSAHDNAIPPMLFASIEQQIYQMISVESTCRLALGGPTAPPYPLPGGNIATGPIQQLVVAGSTIKLFQPTAIAARPVYAQVGSPIVAMDPNKVWTVKALTLQPLVGSVLPTTLPVPVVLTLTMTHILASQAPMDSTATFNFTVLTDAANNIVSCFPLSLASDTFDGQPEPFCGPNQALLSFGSRLVCRNIKCTSGSPHGYDSSGNIICF